MEISYFRLSLNLNFLRALAKGRLIEVIEGEYRVVEPREFDHDRDRQPKP
jgi:hypothetical protein